jgi:hypothetical protein
LMPQSTDYSDFYHMGLKSNIAGFSGFKKYRFFGEVS